MHHPSTPVTTDHHPLDNSSGKTLNSRCGCDDPQATVGLLVAKTLTNATANPFLSGGSGAYNPVLALDVFLVQVRLLTLCCLLSSRRAWADQLAVCGHDALGARCDVTRHACGTADAWWHATYAPDTSLHTEVPS
jgi:hypothetical protein